MRFESHNMALLSKMYYAVARLNLHLLCMLLSIYSRKFLLNIGIFLSRNVSNRTSIIRTSDVLYYRYYFISKHGKI